MICKAMYNGNHAFDTFSLTFSVTCRNFKDLIKINTTRIFQSISRTEPLSNFLPNKRQQFLIVKS